MNDFVCSLCGGSPRYPRSVPGPSDAPGLRQPCSAHLQFFDDAVLVERATALGNLRDSTDVKIHEWAAQTLRSGKTLDRNDRAELVRINERIGISGRTELVKIIADRIENDGAEPTEIVGNQPGALFTLSETLRVNGRPEAAKIAYDAFADNQG